MTELGSAHPLRVVLGPDYLLRGLVFELEAQLLDAWGSGQLLPVVTTPLLRQYLKLLGKAGLPESQLRHWALWCTAPSRSAYIEKEQSEGTALDCCVEAAQLGHARYIISGLPKLPSCPIPWYSAEDFFSNFES